MTDYLPHRDLELAGWATRFAQIVSEAPGDYGLTAGQAADYAAAQQDYVEALTTAMQPSTRTPPAVQRKNDAKAELVMLSRRMVSIVQAYPGTTDTARVALEITVRKKRVKAVAATTQKPRVRVLEIAGGRVKLEIRSFEGHGRARPRGVKGYTLYSFVGPTPPTSLRQWTFEGNDIEPTRTVRVPPDVPSGSQVWFVANWFNNRMQPGPMSDPVTTHIVHRLVRAAGSSGLTASDLPSVAA